MTDPTRRRALALLLAGGVRSAAGGETVVVDLRD